VNKPTFGELLKRKRRELSLTQRDLAKKLGTTASHINFLEAGRRRPSLSLIRRLSDILELDAKIVFLLSHPEAEYLLKASGRPTIKPGREAWRRLVGDRELIAKEHINRQELSILRRVSLLNRVSSVNQLLFILKTLRLFGEEQA
jgi:transcriptional regulator with XRE-family HTH domain